MPKTQSKSASRSKSHSPYAPSSRSSSTLPKRVTFAPAVRDDAEDCSSDSDEVRFGPSEKVNIRALFSDRIKGWSDEKIQRFTDYMHYPYDMAPIPPRKSTQHHRYHFGYYISFTELCKFSEECNVRWTADCPPDPGAFLESVLNVIMLDGRKVRLRSAWVREEDKARFPRMEESVGEECYIVVVLSMADYLRGSRPTNFEVKEVTNIMRRKPIWWKGV
ncbi:hypothetical protein EIP91_002506 [Steccherinum ochraceum]|uniref:Uncharacterized protein n=1 Tax=Steccherinum ochraceum TaxID=92696 RepID=A0A4R0RDZ1_9APHY|nr:hypothetical protein EIP91_002506 [Steccherinum ochraceum]